MYVLNFHKPIDDSPPARLIHPPFFTSPRMITLPHSSTENGKTNPQTNAPSVLPKASASTNSRLASLGQNHGYLAERDTVLMHTRLNVADQAALDRNWALQLWATDQPPASTEETRAGLLIAEAPLPAIGPLAAGTEHVDFSVSAFLTAPPGSAYRAVSLALASGDSGRFTEIHDFAVYPLLQTFVGPRLDGSISYSIHGNGNSISLRVGRITNPRDARNVSGSLSLELWALPHAYKGGGFQGIAVAGIQLGHLPGQYEWVNTALDLEFTPPPHGTWHFVLMLREWSAAGYLTRDFSEFANTVTYGPVPALAIATTPALETVAEKTPGPQPATADVSVPETETKAKPAAKAKAKAKPNAKTKAEPEVKSKTKAAKAETPATKPPAQPAPAAAAAAPALEHASNFAPAPTLTYEDKPAKNPTKRTTKAKTKGKTQPAPAATAAATDKGTTDSPAAFATISVNRAKAAHLAQIKGLPTKVAAAIVQGRPYTTIEDLLKIKGIGEKRLQKVRAFLKPKAGPSPPEKRRKASATRPAFLHRED